jgi:uncharacterized protein
VLALSLGMSAVYSVVNFTNLATRDVPIGQQTTALNPALSTRPVFDVVYRLLSIAADLAPVALVVFLLWSTARPHLGRLGIDARHPARDVGWGAGLVLAIGVPGLGLYLAGRALGLTVGVQASELDAAWYTVPLLVLSALRAGVLEEVIVVGYLTARLRDLRWGPWAIILGSALLRGVYHLYQGVPGLIGNVVMGVVFAWLYQRTGRLVPLVVAHTLIDTIAFVGYPVAAALLPDLFGA